MRFKNAKVLTAGFKFVEGGFDVENGRFKNVLCNDSDEGADMEGAYILPGLIDIHTHGNSGCDFSDGDLHGLRKMAVYFAKHGITSFAPASMTLPEEDLNKAYKTAAALNIEQPEGMSILRGVNMEGPFFSAAKKGAQNGLYLKAPDYDMFIRLNEAANGLVRIANVAPELPGAIDFIEKVSRQCVVSIAHTDAGYDESAAAIKAGASHVTHLFNAMPPLHHRKPGVIPAAAEAPNVTAELIADGMHVHPSVVRAAYKLFGAERLCLVSDSLSCCGMPEGEYMLGGQKVYLSGSVARLADGTIAGSANNLFGILRLAISFGIPKEDAVRMASLNPARVLSVQDEVGSIENGKRADFLVCSADLDLRQVYISGRPVEMN